MKIFRAARDAGLAAMILVGLASCLDNDSVQLAVDNSSPLSPTPLPDFTFVVQISPKAAERLAAHNSRVRVSVLPLKVAEAGETPDWWSWITMGPARDIWVSRSGEVTFSGLKVKSRFLGNRGRDKIIANVNITTEKPEVDQIGCLDFDAPVAELVRSPRIVECRLTEEWPYSQSEAAADKARRQ
jgi:hypothetical protein